MEDDDPFPDASPLSREWVGAGSRIRTTKPGTPRPDSRDLGIGIGGQFHDPSHLSRKWVTGEERIWAAKSDIPRPDSRYSGNSETSRTRSKLSKGDGLHINTLRDYAKSKQEISSNAIASHSQQASYSEEPTFFSSRSLKCPYCAVEFSEHRKLKEHLCLRANGEAYSCKTCDSSFNRAHDLRRHVRLHANENKHNELMPPRGAPVINDAESRDLAAKQSSSLPPTSQSSKPISPIHPYYPTYPHDSTSPHNSTSPFDPTYKEGWRDAYKPRGGESKTSTTDTDSIMSSVEPSNSSTSSAPTTGDISNIAAHELTSVFLQHPEMQVLFEKAIQSDKIGTMNFELKTRRLLNDYSLILEHEARGFGEIPAAALVRRRSRYMARMVRKRIEQQTGLSYLQIKDRGKLIDRQMRIERHLQRLKANVNEKTGKPRNLIESEVEDGSDESEDGSDESEDGSDESEDGSDESEDDWAHDLDRDVPALSAVKSFLVEIDAFIELRAKLWDLVDPSLKFRLNSISTEVEAASHESELIQVCLGAAGCALSCCKKDWSNVWKEAVEDYTGAGWDWWPLEQLRPKLPAGYNRLHWRCSCGEDRYEDVPMFFAEQIIQKRRSQPLDLPASNPQIPTQTGVASSPSNHNSHTGQQRTATFTKSLLDGSNPQQFLAPKLTNERQRAQGTAKYQTEFGLHVLLNVPVGDDLSLKRIDILDYRDDIFFEKLRAAYISAKGLLRRVFSIWIYSHCDFFKFEKFDEEEVAPCGPGIPPPANKDYQYDPKPVRNMPPITKHEFKKRFYACHRGCNPLIYGFRNPLFRCRKPCRYSPDAVNRLPKRLWPLEMGGTARETFWGLYVVENISFSRVAVFHAIFIAPALVFWFLWLFYWGHPGDLQNASVPFLCALGIISLFWYPLYCGKAVVSAK